MSVSIGGSWLCDSRLGLGLSSLGAFVDLGLVSDRPRRACGVESVTGSSVVCCMLGSVALLELVKGRRFPASTDCVVLLKSVEDLAAGLARASATGTGAVELRLLLVVLRLRLPSSLERMSR